MSQLDTLIQQIGTTDTRKKIQIGNDIANILNSSANFECEDIGMFVDGLVPWLQNSNFKVVLNGLDVMYLLVQKLGKDFRPYITSIIPPTIDRLGDSKDVVREKSQLLLSALMICVITPNQLFEKLMPAFSHKNGKVREEVMYCLQNTLNNHGASSITISRLMPLLVKLLSDPTATVRDCAFNTIVETYKHYGERLRMDLQKKFSIPPTKLPALMMRCDELRDSGLLMTSATGIDNGRGDDETDRSSVKSGGSRSRTSSAPPVKRTVLGGGVSAKPSGGTINETNGMTECEKGAANSLKRATSLRRKPSLKGTAAGAMDEASFFSAFEDVPKVTIYNAKDLDSMMIKIRECIQNTQNEWDKRIESLKKIRSVIVSGGLEYEEFYNHLRLLEPAMQISIKDLRSQVVREACITVAYMSQELQTKLDHFCEMVLPPLVNLIPNTVKIMASASVVTIRFIIQNTHHHKLIPILTRELSTKSKEIRKTIYEFLDQLVHTWPSYTMEKHIAVLAEAIKKGVSDADPEARAYSRKAYWGFADHYKEEADRLLASLDPSYRKMLQVEIGGNAAPAYSSSSASHSRPASRPWSRASSAAGSTENLASASHYNGGGKRISGIPAPHMRPPPSSASPQYQPSPRSNSAIDLQAVRRSQTRAHYAHQQRMKIGSGASLPRPRKMTDHPPITSPDRVPRSRCRGGVSQSQPGSRSGSPSSRLSYATYTSPASGGAIGRPHRPSGIPRSTGTSRDPSPNRFGGYGSPSPSTSRSRSIYNSCDMPPQIPSRTRQTMTHKILQQSREAENALADALVSLPPNVLRTPNRKHFSSKSEDHSDNESETSSICSDRSFDSYRKNDYFRYSPKKRVLKETWDNQVQPMDINEIILYCISTNWKDRKEGLASLHSYLMREKQMLTGSQLKRVTDLFTKMFVDTTTKAYSLFLDTVMALIIVHSSDLQDWLYILLIRLLMKLGGDLLGSVQSKIHTTLDLVRDSFKCDLQFQVLMRFLTDPTQTPNTKVKVATLTYLKCLVDVMDGGELLCSQDTPVALTKILAWTADQKSVEVRRASSAAFIAMFNCNMTDLMTLLQQLPQACQNTASTLIQNHLKRSASVDASPSSLPSWNSPSGGTPTMIQSPNSYQPRLYNNSRTPRLRTHDLDDTENLNPEEVSRSLKRTMDEIRNYSFELDIANEGGSESLEKQRDSTSQDSGISQLSLGGGGAGDFIDARVIDEANGFLSGVSSPTHRNLLLESPKNGMDPLFDEEITKMDGDLDGDTGLMNSIISELSITDEVEPRVVEKKAALSNLIRLARSGSPVVWNEKFRTVLRILLQTLSVKETAIRVLVMAVITEMIKRGSLVQHFLNFSELIILRVLRAHGDKNLEVVRGAQVCCSTMAEILPPDVVIRILKPLVHLAEFPMNQAAIKMLDKLVEAHPPPIVASILPEVMPSLIKAYDNKDSCVRKAAVFCMVSFHNSVGETTIRPHLESLTGSKLKLLNLYIRRAEERNSGASSPKSEAQM